MLGRRLYRSVDPNRLHQLRTSGSSPYLLIDLRERWEVEEAALPGDDVLVLPISEMRDHVRFTDAGFETLVPAPFSDRDARLVLVDHHGTRAGLITKLFAYENWTDVSVMQGGIHRYSDFDTSIPKYESDETPDED